MTPKQYQFNAGANRLGSGPMDMANPPQAWMPVRHRPLHLLDLMMLVAAIGLSLVSPAIMKAIIPAASHRN